MAYQNLHFPYRHLQPLVELELHAPYCGKDNRTFFPHAEEHKKARPENASVLRPATGQAVIDPSSGGGGFKSRQPTKKREKQGKKGTAALADAKGL